MNTLVSENPYRVLSVDREAGEAEIKRAYFSKVREHPPETDPEGFKRIRAAYERLRVAAERVKTDLFLIEDQPVALEASSFQMHPAEPLPVTLEMIKADLLGLESLILLEEFRAEHAEPTGSGTISRAARSNTG